MGCNCTKTKAERQAEAEATKAAAEAKRDERRTGRADRQEALSAARNERYRRLGVIK